MLNVVGPSLNILAGMGLTRVNLVRGPTPEYAIGKKRFRLDLIFDPT